MFFWLQRRTSIDIPVEKYYWYNVCIMVRFFYKKFKYCIQLFVQVFTENELNSVTTTFIIFSIVKFFLIENSQHPKPLWDKTKTFGDAPLSHKCYGHVYDQLYLLVTLR